METRITPTTTRILKSPIRPELPAQYVQQLPSIENLLLHLEGKGRSKNTRIAYEKNLKALAIRTDLGGWIVERTNLKERAKQLLTEDFQYQLTTPDGTMLFRKPK